MLIRTNAVTISTAAGASETSANTPIVCRLAMNCLGSSESGGFAAEAEAGAGDEAGFTAVAVSLVIVGARAAASRDGESGRFSVGVGVDVGGLGGLAAEIGRLISIDAGGLSRGGSPWPRAEDGPAPRASDAATATQTTTVGFGRRPTLMHQLPVRRRSPWPKGRGRQASGRTDRGARERRARDRPGGSDRRAARGGPGALCRRSARACRPPGDRRCASARGSSGRPPAAARRHAGGDSGGSPR